MIKIALIGKKAAGKTFAAFYLKQRYKFKKMRMDDGVTKAMRSFYTYGKHQRASWERRLEIYDALYKVDPSIHIDYMLFKLETTTIDVVIEDVRYTDELQKLKAAGFTIVRIAAPDNRRTRIVGMKSAAAGTLVLQEYFNEDKTKGYSADFSIYNNTRDGTRRSLDNLIDTMRNNSV